MWNAKVLSLSIILKLVWFLRCFILPFSVVSSKLQDIEKGNHDDKVCEEYHKRYKHWYGKELPNCQFKSNKSQIQNLIRKVHVDANGSLLEVNPIDKEIQTLMSSNLVQQLLSMGIDASLIKSACEKQVLKSGEPPFLDLYYLALSPLDADSLEHLLSFIDDAESLSLEQFTSELFKYLKPDTTERKRNGNADGSDIKVTDVADGNCVELHPMDKEIQTSVVSNLVQQVLSMGFDASLAPLIKSILEKQSSKCGQPSSLDINSLVLNSLDTETLQHLISSIDEFLLSEQSDSTERKRNEKITRLVNFMNRHCLTWTNDVVQSKDSDIALKPLWLVIETYESLKKGSRNN